MPKVGKLLIVLFPLLLAGCAGIFKPGEDAVIVTGIRASSPITVSPEPTTEDHLYPVLFGTSRKATEKNYSSQRDSQVNYGRVWVRIPKGHITGSTGESPFWPWQNDTRLNVNRVETMPSAVQFVKFMRSGIKAERRPQDDFVVVFIHGFNNTFDDAAIRAAQIGADLEIPANSMMLFSWAARNSIEEYTVDEATVDASEVHLRAFLNSVMEGAGPRKVHVIAHSMGNRAFLRTVAASLVSVSDQRRMKFGQVILAAADVDSDLFAQLAPSYLKVASNTTVYLSPYDYAVHASNIVHQYPRVGCGDAPQVIIPGIDNVVSLVPDDIPAHAYFAEALPVLIDIKSLLYLNVPRRPASFWKYENGFWTVGTPQAGALPDRLKCETKNPIKVTLQ
jgi:esterase/lipase superfamily enzyme